MVAYRPSTTIANRCALIALEADQIAGSSAKVSVYCYASSQDDDEPH
jgi:hypothetical protein